LSYVVVSKAKMERPLSARKVEFWLQTGFRDFRVCREAKSALNVRGVVP